MTATITRQTADGLTSAFFILANRADFRATTVEIACGNLGWMLAGEAMGKVERKYGAEHATRVESWRLAGLNWAVRQAEKGVGRYLERDELRAFDTAFMGRLADWAFGSVE